MSQTTDNHEYYLSQIHQLKQLQKVDDQIYDVKKVLELAPSEFKELQDSFIRVEMQRNHINDKISHLRDQESRINREMEEEKARLKKSKNKLMATGSEKEFHAVSREIDNIEKLSQPREDERIAVLDELKTQLEQLSGIEEQYIDLKAQVEARKATMETQIKEAEARLAELSLEREACSRDIPLPIFQRYEFIRVRLEHPVIVPLAEGICPSCHIAVPPQTFNELLRGEHILSCPNCQRLIVWRDDYLADDPEAQKALAEEQERLRAAEAAEAEREPEPEEEFEAEEEAEEEAEAEDGPRLGAE